MEQGQVARFALFSDVPGDKLSEIERLCDVVEFKPRDVIFNQGEQAEALYGVLSGAVELSLLFTDKFTKTDIQYEDSVEVKLEVTKKPIVFETVVPGEILGWSVLVSPNQLTATAQCAELTQVFALPAVKFKAILDTDPALGYTIMAKMAQIISRRLHSLTARLIEAWGEAFGVDTM